MPLHDRRTVRLSGSIPTIVRAFKAATTRRINELRRIQSAPVWQRNYHEHLIRDDVSLQQIREYILQNPARWPDDPENQS
jgi:REP element-mobilizing transposase RayT